MSDKTKIEWCDASWNPVTGCTKVSAGCKHCYAEREWPRLTRLVPSYAGRKFSDVRTHADRLSQPLHWKKSRRVFVNSMSDLFHSDVPEDFILSVFVTMAAARQHTFQVLTKRPERMLDLLTRWKRSGLVLREGCGVDLRNVWLGVSVEDQASADERIPLLLETPAAVRWVSAEPLLGSVNLRSVEHPNYSIPVDALSGIDSRGSGGLTRDIERGSTLDWVVVGGESGPKARPMNPSWVRSLRDQCAAAGVPFLFKQWGEYLPITSADTPGGLMFWPDDGGETGRLEGLSATAIKEYGREFSRVGKKRAGRLLYGVLHDGYPKIERGE